jgi:hypothetical protein
MGEKGGILKIQSWMMWILIQEHCWRLGKTQSFFLIYLFIFNGIFFKKNEKKHKKLWF